MYDTAIYDFNDSSTKMSSFISDRYDYSSIIFSSTRIDQNDSNEQWNNPSRTMNKIINEKCFKPAKFAGVVVNSWDSMVLWRRYAVAAQCLKKCERIAQNRAIHYSA